MLPMWGSWGWWDSFTAEYFTEYSKLEGPYKDDQVQLLSSSFPDFPPDVVILPFRMQGQGELVHLCVCDVTSLVMIIPKELY